MQHRGPLAATLFWYTPYWRQFCREPSRGSESWKASWRLLQGEVRRSMRPQSYTQSPGIPHLRQVLLGCINVYNGDGLFMFIICFAFKLTLLLANLNDLVCFYAWGGAITAPPLPPPAFSELARSATAFREAANTYYILLHNIRC